MLLASILASASAQGLPAGLAAVHAPDGWVVGTTDGAVRAFLGIPYAEPPVGALRFRQPVPASPWTTPRDARSYGRQCPQIGGGAAIGDEDCLVLNVWSPDGAVDLPVMVFVHGGSFTSGSGSVDTYEGTNLAANGDAVIVTVNYRLGALGFLVTDALQAESTDGRVGNLGIADQVLALEWVRDQIGAFGGDPTEVTVFGESAGGISVCALIGAPEADGLFSRAIVQSGGGCDGFPDLDTPTRNKPSMRQRGLDTANALGCGDDPACLRALPWQRFLDPAAQPAGANDPTLATYVSWGPAVDGVFLPEDPFERIADGSRADLQLVLGSNDEEWDRVLLVDPVLTVAGFRQHVSDLVGSASVADVEALYPPGRTTPQNAWASFFDDLLFTCPTVGAARAHHGDANVYFFDHVLHGAWAVAGAAHAFELPFVFGNPGDYRPDASDQAVSADMQAQWLSIGTMGVPDPARWPVYDPAASSVAVFGSGGTIVDPGNGRCDGLRAAGLVR
ncbi:MAG: carboxylesterase family protein [Alphaproteobacteria bacterium]|nr:carboxylesterase family protein [Alphaproteobacteria bacterium]